MKKKPSKVPFLTILGLIGLCVMTLGIVAVVIFLRSPLAKPISLKIEATPVPTVVSPAAVEVTPTSAPVGLCGNQGSLKILFLGTDQTGGVWPQGADSVRVIKVDFDQQAITVVSFPRDMWVKTADLAGQNLPETRLGLAYYYKKNATSGEEKAQDSAAATLIGQALYDNFSLVPQAYFVMHMENIAEIIDSVDGVDINNPSAFTSERKIDFPAGMLHLNGSQAYEFIRSYVPGGDTARRQRQNLFIRAMQNKMLSPDMLIKLPGLVEAFDEMVVTDLTPQLITSLICTFQSVPPSQVNFYDISADLFSERTVADSGTVLDPNVDAIKAKLSEWLGE
jgi:LCP family protein required for cell wall assembly